MRHALLIALLLPPVLSAQPIQRNAWIQHPVEGRHGMAVCQEARAAQVGADVLGRGGNAVDAAVATAFALAVTLPRAGNLGGGGFAIVHLAGAGRSRALDFRETAPAAADAAMFRDAKGQPVARRSRFTPAAVGVPGSVAGLCALLEAHGSGRLTRAQLLAPAIRLAREGFVVGRPLARSLAARHARLARWPASRAIFCDAAGRPLAAGATLRQPDLARVLAAVAARGAAAFYKGEIAGRLVDGLAAATDVPADRSRITRADLAGYRPVWREPLVGRHQGLRILTMPAPSAGGLTLLQALGMLGRFPLARLGAGRAETIHLVASALQRAHADRSAHAGDPAHRPPPVAFLLSPAHLARRAASIGRLATSSQTIRPGTPPPAGGDETTHLSVVDAAGNAVALTTTLNFSYGSGIVAPGTGVLLNNEMDDFAARPGTPNAYGLVQGEANAVRPGLRPASSMTPTVVLRDERVWLVTGSPGGSRIPSVVLGLLLNLVVFEMNLAEATHAPRVHHQWLPDELRVERGLSPDTLDLLRARGHRVVVKPAMGGTQSILRGARGLEGASDPRRPGGAAVGVDRLQADD